MSEEFNILEKKDNQLGFKLESGEKVMPRVFEEYDQKEIKTLYELYDNCDVDYGLKLTPGVEIDGKIVGESGDDYLVDVDYKDYIRVEKKNEEIQSLYRYSDEDDNINFGTPVSVMVTEVKENPYLLRGSFAALSKRDAQEDMIKDKTIILDAKVLSWSPAGFKLDLIYDCFKFAAFMPNTLAGVNKLTSDQSQDLVGSTIEVMIDNYVEFRDSYIVSRKRFLQTLVKERLKEIEIFNEEDNSPILYTGKVTGTVVFGIFVQFDECLTGMIHKDNFDEETAASFNNGTIKAGDSIDFYIKEINGSKIILTKVWRETLWDVIKQGDKFENEIKEFKKFGALVRLDEETVGLIHNSELEKSRRDFKDGDTVKVKVLSVQRMERKINLMLDE